MTNADERRCSLAACRGRRPSAFLLAVIVSAGPLASACLGEATSQPTGPKPHPIQPPSASEIDKALERGTAFLLATQNKDGSWGSARRTKNLNIYAPVPGAHHAFRVAVTSLCVSALIEAGGEDETVGRAVDRGEAYLIQELPKVRRAVPRALYNVWAHAYGIRAMVRMFARRPGEQQRRDDIRRLIAGQIDFLKRYESINGGWGYYDFRCGTQRPTSISTSFVTATVLTALHEAAGIGVKAPRELTDRAVKSLLLQQNPDFTYQYCEYFRFYPGRLICRSPGSLGRSQACNLALRLWGDKRITDAVLKTWLDRLFARNGWLSMGRKKPVPHESWCQVAGYFFYYGHFYAAGCIDELPPAQRPHFQDHLGRILLSLQEKDGSWWDYPMYDYHQGWGTAFAMMALRRCARK
ncbi:MAG: prenyltransferase/squalene oxidase repeat-containing protein [Phycisphaerae bacterium]